MAGLFEIGIVSQFVNIDATVGQNALFPVDIADAGSGGDHSFQALSALWGGSAGHGTSLISWFCSWTHGGGKRRVPSQLTFIRQSRRSFQHSHPNRPVLSDH